MALQTGQEQLQEWWVQALSGQRGRSVEEGHKNDMAVPNGIKNSHNSKHESTTRKQAWLGGLGKSMDKTSKWENLVALIFSISDIKGFYSLWIFSETILSVLVDGKPSLPTAEMGKVSWVGPLLGAARTGCLERERKQEAESQQGRQGQWLHQQRSSPDVPKHKDQIRSGLGFRSAGYVARQGHGQAWLC